MKQQHQSQDNALNPQKQQTTFQQSSKDPFRTVQALPIKFWETIKFKRLIHIFMAFSFMAFKIFIFFTFILPPIQGLEQDIFGGIYGINCAILYFLTIILLRLNPPNTFDGEYAQESLSQSIHFGQNRQESYNSVRKGKNCNKCSKRVPTESRHCDICCSCIENQIFHQQLFEFCIGRHNQLIYIITIYGSLIQYTLGVILAIRNIELINQGVYILDVGIFQQISDSQAKQINQAILVLYLIFCVVDCITIFYVQYNPIYKKLEKFIEAKLAKNQPNINLPAIDLPQRKSQDIFSDIYIFPQTNQKQKSLDVSNNIINPNSQSNVQNQSNSRQKEQENSLNRPNNSSNNKENIISQNKEKINKKKKGNNVSIDKQNPKDILPFQQEQQNSNQRSLNQSSQNHKSYADDQPQNLVKNGDIDQSHEGGNILNFLNSKIQSKNLDQSQRSDELNVSRQNQSRSKLNLSSSGPATNPKLFRSSNQSAKLKPDDSQKSNQVRSPQTAKQKSIIDQQKEKINVENILDQFRKVESQENAIQFEQKKGNEKNILNSLGNLKQDGPNLPSIFDRPIAKNIQQDEENQNQNQNQNQIKQGSSSIEKNNSSSFVKQQSSSNARKVSNNSNSVSNQSPSFQYSFQKGITNKKQSEDGNSLLMEQNNSKHKNSMKSLNKSSMHESHKNSGHKNSIETPIFQKEEEPVQKLVTPKIQEISNQAFQQMELIKKSVQGDKVRKKTKKSDKKTTKNQTKE